MKFRWIGMNESGSEVVLRKFPGFINPPAYLNQDWVNKNFKSIKRGVVLDVETTGLKKETDKVIEIGLRCFTYNDKTGDILTFDYGYNAYQDPGVSLSMEIVRLTGITDDMIRGHSIDWNQVDEILADASIIIAHNASFDRPFIERNSKVSKGKIWACTLKQIDWNAKGFSIHKLDILSIYHGFYVDAHRAQNDVDAVLNLLNFPSPDTNKKYMLELHENSTRASVKLIARNSPIETKDFLKGRGYSWDMTNKHWYKLLFKDDLMNEVAILEQAVYYGPFRGTYQDIPLIDNFK